MQGVNSAFGRLRSESELTLVFRLVAQQSSILYVATSASGLDWDIMVRKLISMEAVMRHSFLPTTLAKVSALSLFLVLQGCAKNNGPSPMVDMAGVDMARYRADLLACQQYAKQVDPMQDMMLGALLGAAVGAAVGNQYGHPQTGADEGGTALGGAALNQGIRNQRTIVARCMAGRGYKVLLEYGGMQFQDSQGAQYTLPESDNFSVSTGAAAKSMSITQQPTDAQPIAPKDKSPKLGKWSYEIEKAADEEGCGRSGVAEVISIDGAVELYSVKCNDSNWVYRCVYECSKISGLQ